MKTFWTNWQIAASMPNIDFSNDFGLYFMGHGGPHLMRLALEDGANLLAEFVQTPTVSHPANYLVISIKRKGIRSINGRPATCAP